MIGRMLRELVQAQEGKAFPYIPQLTDAGGPLIGSGSGYYGSTNPYVNGGAISYGRTQTPMAQREAGAHLQTYGGKEPVDWLFSAVNFIAQSASSALYHFEDAKGVEQQVKLGPADPPETKQAPNDITSLFVQPNPYQNWQEFLELLLIDYLIVGNAYWVKWRPTSAGKPIALYRMHPAGVKIIADQFGPAKYLYRVPGTAQDAVFLPDSVVHFRRPNPHDPLYGMGIVRGGAQAFDMELALSETMSSYYQKRGLPSGVVQTERRVPRDVFNKLKAQLRSFYTGPANAGQLMVLEAGLQYKAISPSAADALFETMAGMSRDRVLAMFHLNKGLLGLFDGTGDPMLSEWQQLFDTKTMVPLLGKLQTLISEGLTQPGWSLDFKFDYNEVQAPADVIQRATLLAALPGVKVRELREAAGLNPSTGDRDIDETVLNLPGAEMDANGQGGSADRNLPNEPGRPPLPESTTAIAGNAKRASGAVASKAGGSSSKVVGKAFDVDRVLAEMETHIRVLDVKAATNTQTLTRPAQDSLYETRIASIDDLVGQVKAEIAAAALVLERDLLDTSEGKAEATMYQRLKAAAGWARFSAKLKTILQSAIEQALSLANRQHASNGLQPKLDMDYEGFALEAVERAQGGAQSVSDTFQQEFLATIRKMQQRGASNSEFTNAIRTEINDWQTGRAQTIALTEATRAYNEGTLQIAEANNIASVLVSDGEDFDSPCVEANGQTWTLDEARDNLIEHPNCRRAFVPNTAVAS